MTGALFGRCWSAAPATLRQPCPAIDARVRSGVREGTPRDRTPEIHHPSGETGNGVVSGGMMSGFAVGATCGVEGQWDAGDVGNGPECTGLP